MLPFSCHLNWCPDSMRRVFSRNKMVDPSHLSVIFLDLTSILAFAKNKDGQYTKTHGFFVQVRQFFVCFLKKMQVLTTVFLGCQNGAFWPLVFHLIPIFVKVAALFLLICHEPHIVNSTENPVNSLCDTGCVTRIPMNCCCFYSKALSHNSYCLQRLMKCTYACKKVKVVNVLATFSQTSDRYVFESNAPLNIIF